MAKTKLRTLYDPVTLIFALTAVSTAFNVISSIQQGQATASAAYAQADADALALHQDTKEEARNQLDIEREGRRRVAYARAIFGAQGSVSDLGLLTSTSAAGKTEARRGVEDFATRYQGMTARIDSLRSRARSAKEAGVLGAFSSVVSGAGQAAGSYAQLSGGR